MHVLAIKIRELELSESFKSLNLKVLYLHIMLKVIY